MGALLMTKKQKETPAATNGRGSNTIHRPLLVSNNLRPRQRWRGNPKLKPISMSPALEANIIAMTKGGRDDG